MGGASLEEAEAGIRLSIRYHIDELKSDGGHVPTPMSQVNYVAVSV